MAANDQERRLHLKAFRYWEGLRDGREWPSLKDMSQEALHDFRHRSLLIDVSPADGPVVRYVGEDFDQRLGGRVAPGTRYDDIPDGSFLKHVADEYHEAMSRYSAIYYEGEVLEPGNVKVSYRGSFMPMSDDGETIRFLYSVVGWQLNDEPGETALDSMLEGCKQAAKAIIHYDGRSRETLYDALASALGFYEATLEDPSSLETLLKNSDLKMQQRAPITPILKLIFGKDYDKTRITEYAAALSYARRNGQTPDTVKAFFSNTSGGIKGCVKLERIDRRAAGGNKTADAYETAKNILRNQKPMDFEDVKIDDEFGLLLIRKDENGDVILVKNITDKEANIESIIKKSSKNV